jgi:Lon protease-like protein
MGEVVPRCGVGNLIKIIVRESMCQGVMGVRVSMSCRRRVRESSLCPSARFYEDPLQLKRVTFEELPGSKDRRVRRQDGEEAICVSRREDQAWRIVGL